MGRPRLIRRSLYFTAPRHVEVISEPLDTIENGTILVASQLSAISAGTELLLFRNEFPPDVPLDQTIPDLQKPFGYPVKYGYATVGQVIGAGEGVSPTWIGKRVFAFHAHESHFTVPPEETLVLPDDLSWEDAVFLPFMETAVNFLMDGRPVIGEQVAVFGQGVVGLLTTGLLGLMPLGSLVTLDSYALRRRLSMALGARTSLDPSLEAVVVQTREALSSARSFQGADLVYELSGNPDALNQAIAVTGFGGRIVIGSWYGQKRSPVDLGGYFHRSRIRVISSQVSTVAPADSAAWTKGRRLQVALEMIRLIRPSRLITHSVPIEQAGDAYGLLERDAREVMQVIVTYP